MKNLSAIAVIGVLSLGFATSASAFDFSPAATKFTAGGRLTLTQNGTTLDCRVLFHGKTSKTGHHARFVRAHFFTDAGHACASLKAAGLPWHLVPTSLTTIKIEQASFVSSLGTCGPDRVIAQGYGQIAFNHTFHPGNCLVNTANSTVPSLTIVP